MSSVTHHDTGIILNYDTSTCIFNLLVEIQ